MTTATKEEIVYLEPAEVYASPRNYRKTMDKEKMDELIASVKDQGVHTPIWVRENGNGYLLIAGERRLKAAIACGLAVVPAIVKNVTTDEEALELSVIENDQREDVNPMEQALGYQDLFDKGKHTPETLAAKLGKKVPYVLGRLKLLTIPKEAQKALLDGKIEYGHALLISRLKNNSDQNEFLKDIQGKYGSGPLTVVQAQEFLDNFSLKLASAAFDAKVCATCTFRSKAQAGLFPEAAKAADECMDRSCFFLKTREHYQKLAKEMEAKGVTVLTSDKELQAANGFKISPDPSRSWEHPRKYKSMCATCDKRVFYCYEKTYQGGRKEFETGELCRDKKCFNTMNGNKDYSSLSSSGSSRARVPGTGAARQHAIFMRDRFLRSRVPAKVAESDVLQQRLVIFNLLCRFDRFGGQGRIDLKMDHHQVFKELMKEICPAWKPEQYGGIAEQKLYAAVATTPAKLLPAVLKKVVLASVPHTNEEVLLQLTPEAGIDIEKDFLVDETYLNTLTKGELVKLGTKTFGVTEAAAGGDLKKPDLIKLLMSYKLTGKVPDVVRKECKIVTLGGAKGKK